MRSLAILGLTVVTGSVGCASANWDAQRGEPGWSGASGAWNGNASMHVGAVRVMDTHVNPLAPIRLASRGDAIAVSYGRPGRGRAVAHVDAQSLQPVPQPEGVTSAQSDDAAGAPTAANASPARVVLDGGRFVLVWKRGDAESGYSFPGSSCRIIWYASGPPKTGAA